MMSAIAEEEEIARVKNPRKLQLPSCCDSGSESSSEEDFFPLDHQSTDDIAQINHSRVSANVMDSGYVGSPAWMRNKTFNFDGVFPVRPEPSMFRTRDRLAPEEPRFSPSHRRINSCPEQLEHVVIPNRCPSRRGTISYKNVSTQTPSNFLQQAQRDEEPDESDEEVLVAQCLTVGSDLPDLVRQCFPRGQIDRRWLIEAECRLVGRRLAQLSDEFRPTIRESRSLCNILWDYIVSTFRRNGRNRTYSL